MSKAGLECGRCRSQGFTLVELLTTLAIVIITLTYGVPLFKTTVSNNRTAGAASSFASTLSEARSLALSLPASWYVSVVPGSGASVAAAASSPNGWSDGWRIITVPYVGAAGAGALATSGQDWVGATATSLASQTASTAPKDQVYLGYAPTTSTGIQVSVLTTVSGTNTTSNATLTSINLNNLGQLVDANGNLLAGQDVQAQICDLSMSGVTGQHGGRVVMTLQGNITNMPPSSSLYVNPCP